MSIAPFNVLENLLRKLNELLHKRTHVISGKIHLRIFQSKFYLSLSIDFMKNIKGFIVLKLSNA